jgi:hypothetical protein
LTQVYLNSFPFVQAGFNIGFSIVQTSYLLYYTPFKEKDILFSSIVGEICVLAVLCLTTFYLGNIGSELSYVLEIICICIVLGCMVIQFIVSVYSVIKAFRRVLRKVLKYRALVFVESYDRTTTNNVSADNTTNIEIFPEKLPPSPRLFNN